MIEKDGVTWENIGWLNGIYWLIFHCCTVALSLLAVLCLWMMEKPLWRLVQIAGLLEKSQTKGNSMWYWVRRMPIWLRSMVGHLPYILLYYLISLICTKIWDCLICYLQRKSRSCVLPISATFSSWIENLSFSFGFNIPESFLCILLLIVRLWS